MTTMAPQGDMREGDRKALDEVARQGRVSELRASGWKVELTGGQSATLCDPASLTERQRRGFKVAGVQVREARDREADKGGDHGAAAMAVASDDQLVVTFLRAWTLQLPLPTPANADSLLDLPGPDFDRLVWVCTDLLPDAFVDFGPDLDPASPFGASSA